MNKFSAVFLASLASFACASAFAAPTSQECQKLQNDYNLIYASKGFCFKDADAKAKYGNDNCFTSKPKFSEKEQQRIDQIKDRQKALNCN
ncbi:YARHG domain-containing protein [Acinetobacter apis]|uniref:YARHG domain-containing protein n=1 Tax=Acinetobacter apis TaxID=1229165 RepID=A0A217EFB4_9GAMM|nr:YARHG domain-containing protein [Acinetobacter apis]SNQ29044.1 YARHG domain-containing protein [Acinetobacter apis]